MGVLRAGLTLGLGVLVTLLSYFFSQVLLHHFTGIYSGL